MDTANGEASKKVSSKCLEATVDVIRYDLQIPRFETEYDFGGMTAESPKGMCLSIPVNAVIGAVAGWALSDNPDMVPLGAMYGPLYSFVTIFTSALINDIRKKYSSSKISSL